MGLAMVLSACGGAGGDEDGGGESSGSTGDTPLSQESLAPSDACEAAPVIAQGRYGGTLRDRKPDPTIGGVCGGGGPDVFLRVQVPLRADLRVEARGNGFRPRVSLAPPGCLHGGALICSAEGVAELADLGEGTIIDLAIGLDADTFTELSDVPAPKDGPDPLGFVVDVGMTQVLERGQVCKPAARGRCVSGSLCMLSPKTVDDEYQADRGGCTDVVGDRCDAPEAATVVLEGGTGSLTVDPDLPQSDVHRHSCTGDGTRERVLRLALPAGMGPHDSLQIRVEEPQVGLALRAPSCLSSDEIACAAPSPAGSQVTIVDPEALRRASVQPYLFVELPEPGVLVEPVTLHLRRVLRAPPVGT